MKPKDIADAFSKLPTGPEEGLPEASRAEGLNHVAITLFVYFFFEQEQTLFKDLRQWQYIWKIK